MFSSLVSAWTFPESCNDSISNMLPLFANLMLSGEASESAGEKVGMDGRLPCTC
jgi:hypothetical protein